MTSFDQRQQVVHHQQNAERIVNIGISFEQHRAELRQREEQLIEAKADKQLTEMQRLQLEKELLAVKEKLIDAKASYEARIQELEVTISRLNKLQGQIPDKLIEDAKNALIRGDNQSAAALFELVERQSESHISAAAEAKFQRGKIAEAKVKYREALALYARAVQLVPTSAEYLLAFGNIQFKLGMYAEAKCQFEAALTNFRQSAEATDPRISATLNKLAEALMELELLPEAKRCLEEALTIDIKNFGEVHPDVARDRTNLGEAHTRSAEHDSAIQQLNLALQLSIDVYGERHHKVAKVRSHLGCAYSGIGDFEKTIECYQFALRINEAYYGQNHPNIARDYNHIAHTYSNLGDSQQAIEAYHKALKVNSQACGIEHPLNSIYMTNIGLVLEKQGKFSEATEIMSEAALLSVTAWDKSHSNTLFSRCSLGKAWVAAGNIQAAYDELSNALEDYATNGDPDLRAMGKSEETRIYLALICSGIGYCLRYLGKKADSADYFQKALELLEKTPGLSPLYRLEPLEGMADAYIDESYLTEAIKIIENTADCCAETTARIYHKMADLQGINGNPESEIKFLINALNAYRHAGADWAPLVELCAQSIARCYKDMGDEEKSMEFTLLAEQYFTASDADPTSQGQK